MRLCPPGDSKLRPPDPHVQRALGASGGASGFGTRAASGSGFSGTAGFAAVGASESGAAVCGFAARGFFRNGFVCFATLSHSARSSSLRLRRRRGDACNSGIEVGERFIGRGGNNRNNRGHLPPPPRPGPPPPPP